MIRWLSANWVWLLVVGAMLWMHLGMHHRHGGHSRHAHGGDAAQVETGTPLRSALDHEGHGEPESEPASTGGHRHRGC